MTSSTNKTFNQLFKEIYSDKLMNLINKSPFFYTKLIILKLLWQVKRSKLIK